LFGCLISYGFLLDWRNLGSPLAGENRLPFLSGRHFWSLKEIQILESFSADKTVGIWEIKEQTTQLERVIGWAISAITGLVTTIFKLKLRTQNEEKG